jgi:hypothetical protein
VDGSHRQRQHEREGLDALRLPELLRPPRLRLPAASCGGDCQRGPSRAARFLARLRPCGRRVHFRKVDGCAEGRPKLRLHGPDAPVRGRRENARTPVRPRRRGAAHGTRPRHGAERPRSPRRGDHCERRDRSDGSSRCAEERRRCVRGGLSRGRRRHGLELDRGPMLGGSAGGARAFRPHGACLFRQGRGAHSAPSRGGRLPRRAREERDREERQPPALRGRSGVQKVAVSVRGRGEARASRRRVTSCGSGSDTAARSERAATS